MNVVAEKIQEQLAVDEADAILCQSIFGSVDPVEISDMIADTLRAGLGTTPDSVLLLEFSVGAAIGIQTADDRRVFLKYITDRTLEELHGISAFIGHLKENGFPCPKMLAEPMVAGSTVVLLLEYVDHGRFRDASVPAYRRQIAVHLWRLHDLSTSFANDSAELLRVDDDHQGPLWPRPHNALFDFGRNQDRAAWLDDIASAARRIVGQAMPEEVPIISHSDWSAKHFRFDGHGRVTTIYDWDSIMRTGEFRTLGRALATHLYNWYVPMKTMIASRSQMEAFLHDYEDERGSPLSDQGRMGVSAQACFTLCYVAKCKYSLDADEADRSDEASMLRRSRSGRLF